MSEQITQNTPPVKVLLLGLDMGEFDADRSMDELTALCEANNMEAVASLVQKKGAPEAGTVLGEGKLAEARLYCENLAVETAVFDGELTGSQLRNISDALGVEVIDRTMLILEIFRSRAVTNEGKVQTELALLRYRLPRPAAQPVAQARQPGQPVAQPGPLGRPPALVRDRPGTEDPQDHHGSVEALRPQRLRDIAHAACGTVARQP